MKGRSAGFVGLFFLAISLVASGATPPGAAHYTPAVVERKTFDPANPGDPPPPVHKGETAVCVGGESRCNSSFYPETLYKRKAASGEGFEAAIKTPWVTVNVELTITIWTPINASSWLKEHEEGHRQIFERVYATADKAALAAARNCSGKTFIGTGKTTTEAEKNAMLQAQKAITDDYMASVGNVWARVNDIFDELTAHGMKSAPGVAGQISVPTAIEEAFKRYEAEKAAATQASVTQPSATQPAAPKPPSVKK